jgi:hypothetical protein
LPDGLCIFKPKIPIWGNFGGPWNWKGLANLGHITVIWYIFWPFGNVVAIWYLSPILVYCVKKNLANLWRK